MPGNSSTIERAGTGFSLVEVLVASAIFSIGCAGLALMLMRAVHGSAEARNRSVATMEASSLAELILLNPAALGHYVDAAPASANCISGTPCDSAEWAADNLERWQLELQQSLADATGLVCRDASSLDGTAGEPACDGTGSAVVKVFWNEAGPAAAAAPDRHRAVARASQ